MRAGQTRQLPEPTGASSLIQIHSESVIPVGYFIAIVAIADSMAEPTSCDICHQLLVGVWTDKTCPPFCLVPVLMDSYHNLAPYTFKHTYDWKEPCFQNLVVEALTHVIVHRIIE